MVRATAYDAKVLGSVPSAEGGFVPPVGSSGGERCIPAWCSVSRVLIFLEKVASPLLISVTLSSFTFASLPPKTLRCALSWVAEGSVFSIIKATTSKPNRSGGEVVESRPPMRKVLGLIPCAADGYPPVFLNWRELP